MTVGDVNSILACVFVSVKIGYAVAHVAAEQRVPQLWDGHAANRIVDVMRAQA